MGSTLERCVTGIVRGAAVLVLPVSLLLFLQWPLRDLVHAGSREANDLAQILFALYVSVALTAATRDGSHLAADMLARRYRPWVRDWLWKASCLLIAIPAALFVLWTGTRGAWSSMLQLEHFPETMNPGYFLIRLAAMLLALLVLVQAILDLVGVRREAA